MAGMSFHPPGPEERRRAIGALDDLSPTLQRAFSPDHDFDPLPSPGPHDWLSVARERGQTFDQFVRTATNRPDATRRRLYLRPVGEVAADRGRVLEDLRAFACAFFVQDVGWVPPLPIDAGIARRRNRYTGDVQLNTRDLLARLAREVPSDAWAVLAVSTWDLYPQEHWNFVFGEALLDDRVGVFSIARYDPGFYGQASADRTLLLRRSSKVLAHEACHMLGVLHCIYFNCLMNGSNHLAESDRRPLHLCPVDLRKLHWALGVDLVERYRRLLAFWRAHGIADEAAWVERRLAALAGA